MKPFTTLDGLVVPVDRANIDTDQIIPKQFLKSILRSGLAAGLFFDWRFLPGGAPNLEFTLNQPRYQGASILLVRENFGCGSSREHAPWALKDFGILCIIGSSFADIFYNNCFKNGMLPIVLTAAQVDALFQAVERPAGLRLHVDLARQMVGDQGGWHAGFEIDPYRKQCLLEGLDDIAVTLQHEPEITAFEAHSRG
ncbi:MAG: 3-isopropylmalate dehydratase small subunit [Terriglobales bacterium]